MRQSLLVRVSTVMALAATSASAEEKSAPAPAPAEEPARLWMTGSVERPPPSYEYAPNTMALYHGNRRVSIAEFVRIAGYDDVADRLERRTLTRRLIMVGGLGVAIAGGVMAYNARSCDDMPLDDECAEARNQDQHRGLAVFAVGAVIIVGAKLLLPDLRPALHDMRKMETDYNARLRVTPVVSANGAGVRAELGF